MADQESDGTGAPEEATRATEGAARAARAAGRTAGRAAAKGLARKTAKKTAKKTASWALASATGGTSKGIEWAVRAALALLPLIVLGLVLIAVAIFGAIAGQQSSSSNNCNTTSSSAKLPTPPAGQLSAGQMVTYLQSTGLSANAAAGIVGNLAQESGLNPTIGDGHGGGGLAQWNSTWYHVRGPNGTQSLDAFAKSNGLSPTSDQAQLKFIAYDLKSTAYASLSAKLNTAPDPATAATMFETAYELCSGVEGFMQVRAGSLCNDPNRRAFANDALQVAGGGSAGGSGTAVPVDFTGGGGTCATDVSFVGGSGLDPIPGFTPGRDDMGVDACAKPGMPIIAPAASTLVQILPNWYKGEPLMLFRFNQPMPGTLDNDQYWYVAEQIDPVTVQTPTVFQARQVVAHFAQSGTCIEIGWGSPTSSQRTLAGAMNDAAAANPGRGALTQWGETFKKYFGIPWVGTSPA